MAVNPYDILPLRDDNPSRLDLLGIDDLVAVIEATITRDDLNPITAGVNAPWGGGKTTVLQLLQEHLGRREDVLVVYASPWEYERTADTKSALISAILTCLEGEIQRGQSKTDAAISKLRKLRQRINVSKAVKLATTSAFTMSIPGIDQLVSLFDEEAEGADPSLQGFRKQFEELVSDESLTHIKRVVVLVDDLDRSLPDTVVETLEAIKLFLSVHKMSFVIAADEDSVARAIGLKLQSTGQPTTARQYLEKIVHIPFRIPVLSRERTEEYLALLMLGDAENFEALTSRLKGSRGSGTSLAGRLGNLISSSATMAHVNLAERLSPILHRHTQGNPRRLKRFLNALWLRKAFAASRGVDLEVDACAKLMISELFHPALFAEMIGWMHLDLLGEKIKQIEVGEGEHSEQALEWGRLEPALSGFDLSAYLLLAASLRGQTVEEAALPAELREAATRLTAESTSIRSAALKEAGQLEVGQRSAIARYVAVQLRHQRAMEKQRILAESLSGLADESSVAKTIAEELSLMMPDTILTPVPLALLAKRQPRELVELVKQWIGDEEVPQRTRRAASEALKGVG